MKTAEDILKDKPREDRICVAPEQTVAEAIRTMNSARIGAIGARLRKGLIDGARVSLVVEDEVQLDGKLDLDARQLPARINDQTDAGTGRA